MNKKLIGQNPERYKREGAQWKISSSPNVEPLYLPIGVNPTDLLPVLEVDGVIVEVGGYKLISQTTLNNIKDSNNPHYDLNENGKVNGVSIGKTIPTLKINLDSLTQSANERDILNRNAGVASVEYIYEGATVGDTNLSVNLVKQINYTLNPNIDRPKDTYTLTELQLASNDVYDIKTEAVVNTQDLEGSIFSYSKLEEFLNAAKDTQINLQKDFTLIKEVFWEGKLPTELNTFKVTKMATAEDKFEEGDIQLVYKSAQPIISVVATPPSNENVQLPKIKTSNVQIWAVSGKGYISIGLYDKDPTTGGGRGRKLRSYGAGARFLGELTDKKFENKPVYRVYDADGTKPIGWVADNRIVTGE